MEPRVAQLNETIIADVVDRDRAFDGPYGLRVYVFWQLVDADSVRIHDSTTLPHVQMNEIANILIPNENVVRMQTTDFD